MNRLRLQAQEVSPQLPSSSSSVPSSYSSSSSSSSSFSSSLSLSSSSSSSSCSSSSIYTHYTNPFNLHNTTLNRQDNQNFPESWSQLLIDGLVEEEEEDDDDDRSRSFAAYFQPNLVENWRDEVLYTSPDTRIVDPKQESYQSGYMYQNKIEDIQITMMSPFWTHALQASSIDSCATTSLSSSSSSSMLDFSKNKPHSSNLPGENSSECNSTTGSALKKARVQTSSVPQLTIKVRKEKLGDRITALHQLVSPFGKTDTASVLQEAIGYIRFLHHQIEALCLPYLVDQSTNSRQLEKEEKNDVSREDSLQQDQDACDEPMKDLRSKGLGLVPTSLILHVERENKANYGASNLGT